MTCPCLAFACPDCNPRAPYFCRSNGSVLPEGWPVKGYREKRANGKTYTVSAHDLVIRMLKAALVTERAEYLKERGAIVRQLERENKELQQGENLLLFN